MNYKLFKSFLLTTTIFICALINVQAQFVQKQNSLLRNEDFRGSLSLQQKDEVKRKIKSVATKALETFPSKSQYQKHSNKDVRTFAEQVQALLKDARKANSWNDEKLKSFLSRVDRLHTQGQSMARMRAEDGGGTANCTNQCVMNKENCLDDSCGEGVEVDFPCWCCVDCRLAFLACLTGCTINGGFTFHRF